MLVVQGSKTTTDYWYYYLKSCFLEAKWKIFLICYKVHSDIYKTTACGFIIMMKIIIFFDDNTMKIM